MLNSVVKIPLTQDQVKRFQLLKQELTGAEM